MKSVKKIVGRRAKPVEGMRKTKENKGGSRRVIIKEKRTVSVKKTTNKRKRKRLRERG